MPVLIISLSLNELRDNGFAEAFHLFILWTELKQNQIDACVFKFAQLILNLRRGADKS